MTARHGNSAIALTIEVSEFKAKCLEFLDEISANGGEIVITKNGFPRIPACTLSGKTEKPVRD